MFTDLVFSVDSIFQKTSPVLSILGDSSEPPIIQFSRPHVEDGNFLPF